jgi:tetratricopeptide (TPR) repeat protein
MRAFVFTDSALVRQAGRFVWLDIDTEKPQNAGFRQQYAVQALPSYFIVDPDSEAVLLRWVGGASVAQMLAMLDAGQAAYRGVGQSAADTLLAQADRLYGDGDNARAAEVYREALSLAPDGWASYGRAIESLLLATTFTEEFEACAALSQEAFAKLRSTASAANVAALGLDAALSLPADHPQRAAWVQQLEANGRAVASDLTLPIVADERSGLFGVLVSARQDAHDDPGAKEVARQWATFLEGEAERAAAPAQRTVFDSHRLSAYLEMGEPGRAIPMLEASERDFPDDYNPPARLAVAYKAMQRWDDAIAASDRALVHAYGPRKLRILQTRADVCVEKGDTDEARRTLEEALSLAESLPPGQRNDATIGRLRDKLAAVSSPSD